MNEEISKLVYYRLDRANESIREAELLLDAGHANTCVNRLYYACMHVFMLYQPFCWRRGIPHPNIVASDPFSIKK